MIENKGSVTVKKTKKILSWLLCFVFLCSFLALTGYSAGVRTGETTAPVNVRSAPDTSKDNIIFTNLPAKVTLIIYDEVMGNTTKPWYQVEFDYGGVHYSGYISSGYVKITSESFEPISGVVNDKVNVRSGPGSSYSILYPDLPRGVMVTIVDKVNSWYKVEFNYGGKTYENCYIYSSYISTTITSVTTDIPAEYASYIAALKAKHPNWTFKFLYTDLDWAEVLKNENVLGRSLVSSNSCPQSYFSKAEGAYNSSTGQYIAQDGSTWFQANSTVVAHYLDPRNFLTDDAQIFQFELLANDSATQTLSGVQQMLKGTFMENAVISTGAQGGSADLTGDGNVDIVDAMKLFQFVSGTVNTLGEYSSRADVTGDGNTDIADAMKLFQYVSGTIDSIGSTGNITYAEAFMQAASISSVSPYHLVARVIQEVTRNGSGSTSGNYGNYKGIYNFYNIGASAGTDPVSNGLAWASNASSDEMYLRPWNSQYKSVVGGAIYIGNGYINVGQNTLYLQKFDVDSTFQGLYWHQYMGNIQAPYSETKTIYKNYGALGILDNSFTFVIPVYNNMPSSPCQLP